MMPSSRDPAGTSQTVVASSRREYLFAALSVLISLALTVAAADWLLGRYLSSLSRERMDAGLVRYQARLGWELSPDWHGRHEHHDYDVEYQIDRGGWRRQSEPAGAAVSTIAVVGDSFTFGLGVNDTETFVSQLNEGADQQVRYLNRAVPGYSTDQEYLLVDQQLARWNVDELWLVVYLANDVLDNARGWPLQAEQAKPWFTLQDDQLVLHHNPVPLQMKPPALQTETLASVVLGGSTPPSSPAFVQNSNLLRVLSALWREGAPSAGDTLSVIERNLRAPLDVTQALLSAVAQRASEQQVTLKVVLLPGRDAVTDTSSVSYLYQSYLRNELIKALASLRVVNVDLLEALEEEPLAERERFYHPNEGHLTAAGHAWVAATLKRNATSQ